MSLLNTVRSRWDSSTNDEDYQNPTSIELATSASQQSSITDNEDNNNLDVDSQDTLMKTSSKTAIKNERKISNWIFALLILSLLSWVVWALITKTYYSSFSSHYFSYKAGSRIFMYTVVFYILIGIITYIGLAHKCHLPSTPTKLLRYVKLPFLNEYYSILEIMGIVVFLAIQASAIAVPVYHKLKPTEEMDEDDGDMAPAKKWYIVGKILGMSATYTMMMLFFPVSKRSFWLELLNIKFEHAIKFHKVLAGILVCFIVSHVISTMTALYMAGQLKVCLLPSEECFFPHEHGDRRRRQLQVLHGHLARSLHGDDHDHDNDISHAHSHDEEDIEESLEHSYIIMYGWIAVVVVLPMLFTSIFTWVRRYKYEWFYYTHVFSFFPFVILLQLHYDSFLYYAAPGLIAYTLDKGIQHYSTRYPVTLLDLSCPIPGIVRIVLAIEPESDHNMGYQPGQWISLNVPEVSLLQYHPLSIASAPPTIQNPTITMDVKVLGDWTRGLEQLALKYHGDRDLNATVTNSTPINDDKVLVYIDGFHGGSHLFMNGYLNHSVVLMIAGGIGVTPLMSSLRAILLERSRFRHIQKLVFVWVVRDQQMLDLYTKELEALQKSKSNNVDILLFVTGGISTPESFSSQNTDNSFANADRIDDEDQYHDTHDDTNGTRSLLNVKLLFKTPIKGYGQSLKITVVAALAFIFGWFFSLFVTHEYKEHEDLRREYSQLLELGLALFCIKIATTFSLHAFQCRSSSSPVSERGSFSNTSNCKSYDVTDVESTTEEEETDRQGQNNHHKLDYVQGSRPKFIKIFDDVNKWCTSNIGADFSTVGVGVCGPKGLVDDVLQNCRVFSDKKVSFVMDHEPFEW